MLINGVDLNIKLTRAQAVFISWPLQQVRVKILYVTLFNTQAELKPLFFLLRLMFWEWNAKHIILLHTQLKLKIYC